MNLVLRLNQIDFRMKFIRFFIHNVRLGVRLTYMLRVQRKAQRQQLPSFDVPRPGQIGDHDSRSRLPLALARCARVVLYYADIIVFICVLIIHLFPDSNVSLPPTVLENRSS